MYHDIRGFKALVELQLSEQTIEPRNTYCSLMCDALTVQGGVINPMNGDGLMAIFGAPQALTQVMSSGIGVAVPVYAVKAQAQR